MAITNPQAVRVSNDKMRPLADAIGQLYNFTKMLQAEAQAEGWVGMYPNDPGETVMDGSDVDGRTMISGADIQALITMTGDFIAWMEAGGNARRNLALKIAVNPER